MPPWDAINSFGLVSSSRARISFCWFPPDKVPALTLMVVARTSKSLTSRRAISLIFWMTRSLPQEEIEAARASAKSWEQTD